MVFSDTSVLIAGIGQAPQLLDLCHSDLLVLSQPSIHLPRRTTILLELFLSVFAYGSRTPAVYEQQTLQTVSFSSADALQPMLCSDHDYL